MDNLSHSLAGLAVAELIHRSLPAEPQAESQGLRRYLLLLTCWLASNFPDLDLVLSPLLPDPLGYLLHHRGHTHTLLYAIPQGLLVCGLLWAVWPAARRLLRESRSARRGFVLAAALGLILHIAMDGLNVYGVHPFHPFDSRWMFGDMVFIIEPLFWVVAGIPVALAATRRWTGLLLALPLIIAPVYFAIESYLAWASAAVLLVLAAVLGGLQYRDHRTADRRGKSALIFAVLLAVGFVGMQGAAMVQARNLVTQSLAEKDPSSRVLDVALNAFPTNPLCWQFVSVESNEVAGTYRLRRGQLSLAPSMMPLSACPAKLAERAGTGSLANFPADSKIAFVAETSASLQQFRARQKESCHFDAWLRFARMPAMSATRATDIRFSPATDENFTTIDVSKLDASSCPSGVPQWDMPRADLLNVAPAASDAR